MKYISDGTWFDKETEVTLIDALTLYADGDESGLFRGIKDGELDEEICLLSEFTIEEDNHD